MLALSLAVANEGLDRDPLTKDVLLSYNIDNPDGGDCILGGGGEFGEYPNSYLYI